MTDTISRTDDDVQQATDDAADAPQFDRPEAVTPPWAAMPVAASTGGRECIDVDPTTLIIGDNVRAAAHLDRQFLASLREFGVMDPIHVTRDQDGTLTVKRGQRRTLGAVKVGLSTVPVLVVDDDTSEPGRIVKQWHENERRDSLTDTDRLAAVEQLTILGIPVGHIAKRLGTPKKIIDAAVQANTSDLAKAAAAKHALTLTDACLIAEFEDNEDVVRDILAAVKRGDSAEHVAQRARDEKARQDAYQQALDAVTDAGVTVIDHPGYDHKTIKPLRDIRLLNKNGTAKKQAPTPDEHAACPGHAAYVSPGYGAPTTTFVCTDPKANKHALSSWKGTTLPGQQSGGGMTEQQKADRRTLIANNKSWESAQKVRQSWLSQAFLHRTSPPKGAEAFLSLAVIHGEHPQEYRLYSTLTGIADDAQPWDAPAKIVARAVQGTPRQMLMIAVGLLVCDWESTISRETCLVDCTATVASTRPFGVVAGGGPGDGER
jgi:ParB family chromosome partitioning protein